MQSPLAMIDRRDPTRNPLKFLHFLRFPGWFPASPLQWVGPLVAAGAAAALLATLAMVSGIPDLSASKPHPAGWARILHGVFQRSTAFHSRGLVRPADFGTAAQVVKGAGYYGMACAHCHGGPGLGQNPVALAMRPRPQYLMDEIASFSDAQLFQIVKHGVKYSGMPAWPVQDRDDEVWSVVSFLRTMPALSTATYRRIAYGSVGTDTPVATLAPTFVSRAYPAGTVDGIEAADLHRASPALGFDEFTLTGNVAGYCARCHVDGGVGQAGGAVPNLTLLGREQLRTALNRYATGARSSAFMGVVATQLSPAQIDALAAWYARTPRPLRGVAQPEATVALGEKIIADGFGAHRRDACSNCHDLTRASNRAYPRLDGQNLMYLRGRMLQFRTQAVTARGRLGNPMPAIAARLSDHAIDAVAAAYAQRGTSSPR